MTYASGPDRRLWSRSWRRTRLFVLDRDGWLCQIRAPGCSVRATTVDHIIARADGGECFDPRNLRAACQSCNARAGAALTNETRKYRTSVARYVSRF